MCSSGKIHFNACGFRLCQILPDSEQFQSELNHNIDLTYIISKYKANIILQVIKRNVSIVVLMITHI